MSKTRRRTKGEGTVYKRGNNWYGSYELSKSSSGKRQKKYFKGSTKKEVRRQIKEFDLEYEDNPEYKKSDVEFIDFAKDFMFEVYKSKKKAATFERNMSIIYTHVVSAPFAQKKIDSIKKKDIQDFISNVKRKDNDSKKTDLEPYSLKKIGLLLNMIFEHAVEKNIIMKNPVDNIDYPKESTNVDTVKELKTPLKEFTDDMYYTEEELDKFKDSLKGEEYEMLFTLEIYTGLRHSEIVALNWDDISFKNKEISITKTLRRIRIYDENKIDYEVKWQYDIPKSKNSERDVPLTDTLVEKLKKYKDEQNKYFENNNIVNEENLVFTDEAVQKIMPHKIRNFNKYIAKKAGLRYLNFHGFRHTYATRLFERGVPIKTVASLLGHSSFETTYKIYTHVSDMIKEETIKHIENI